MIEGDTDRLSTVEQHSRRRGMRYHPQIGPRPRRTKISHRRAAAPAAPCGRLEIAGTFLSCPVEVVIAGYANLLGRRDEGVA
jgi:hypothetical protein